MLKLYFIVILSLILNTTNAATGTIKPDPDSLYIRQAKIFIKDVYPEKLKSKRSVLIEEPKFPDGLKYSDTSFFLKEELSLIKEQIKDSRIKSWRKVIDPSMNCISQDSLRHIFEKRYLRLYNGWDYFYKYVGKDIHTFSSPIFIRNYQYCIFYSEIQCGTRCGNGETYLYKKVNGKWTKFKLLSKWIS